jgi:hypothetical protein
VALCEVWGLGTADKKHVFVSYLRTHFPPVPTKMKRCNQNVLHSRSANLVASEYEHIVRINFLQEGGGSLLHGRYLHYGVEWWDE